MKNRTSLRSCALTATLLGLCSGSGAQTFFQSDLDSSTGWVVNASGASDRAIFGFNYSSVGIPAAPNSGGTTLGLLLQANRSGGVQSGISVSPLGQSFTGDYQLRYDLWQNYNGPLNGGGSGSTQLTGGGIGTAGTTPQRDTGTSAGGQDSVFFMSTGDGGATQDYRVYRAGPFAAPSTGYYAAGTGTSPDARNDLHPYYSSFGAVQAPAAQLTLHPGQTGTTRVGSQGFEWHDVAITKVGNTVTWHIDDVLIATVDITGVALGGNNILLNHSDINAGSSTDVNADVLLFGLVDNVRVTVVPEPSTYALMGLAGAFLLAQARRRKS